MRVLLVIFLFVVAAAEEVLKVSAGDSYMDAYQESKIPSKVSKAEKKSDSAFPSGYPDGSGGQFGPPNSFGPPSYQYGPPNSQYGPTNSQYGPPNSQYGPPNSQYGPPNSQYGPPNSQYGPPNSQYSPPIPQYGPPLPPAPQYGPPPSYGTYAEPLPQYGPPPVYGPPAQNLQVFYGVPHAMINIWDKLWEKIKWKLDLFTFGKILLKLVIFKKIVSLIAILCLLLFIPSLKHKKGLFSDVDGSERGLQIKTNAEERLNSAASFVSEAIHNYMSENQSQPSCDTKYCSTQKILQRIEKKTSYKKLADLYANENEIN